MNNSRPPPTMDCVTSALHAAAKTSSSPAMTPGRLSGNTTWNRVLQRAGLERGRGFPQRRIDRGGRRDDRECHDRQFDLRKGHDQHRLGVEQRDVKWTPELGPGIAEIKV